MHVVFFYALHAHRLEGAGTDMQGDIGGLDPGIAQCIQQGLIEMQPGGRSRHGAGSLRVDGLVTLAIGGIVRPVYIRRQRHVADALEQRQHVLVEDELEQGIVPRDHFSCATTVEQDLRAGLGDLLERTCASTLRLPVTRSTRISSLPPVAF